MSVVSPLLGFLTSNTRFVATFQMLRNSKESRMVSILSGTPLWSRIQTRTGVKVPTSATARSRKTPLASPGVGCAEQARQHLADRVGVADRKRVESVRILDARGDHKVEAED